MANGREVPEALSSHDHSRPTFPRKVTPPERKALPSPPATAERLGSTGNPSPARRLPQSLLDYKHQAEQGDVQPLTFIPISQQEYSDARDEIERSFRRFDYEPRRGRIILRMPSPTHEFFINLFADAISDELKRIGGKDGAAGEFASQILSGGSSRIYLQDDKDDEGDGDDEDKEEDDEDGNKPNTRRQPDAQFQHRKAAFPGVVVEVAYSQNEKRLRRLAKEYIYDSNGDIKAVVGISINYGSSPSTISLWKSRFTRERGDDRDTLDMEQVIRVRPFRTADGQPLNPDETLALNLRDFAPDELSRSSPSVSMPISFSRISDLVDIAQEMQRARESNRGRSTRRIKKRRLSSSSLEELGSEDAARFSDEEKAVAQKADALDKDFEPRAAKRRA